MARRGRPSKDYTIISVRFAQEVREMVMKTSEETGMTMTKILEYAAKYYIEHGLYKEKACVTKKSHKNV